MVHRYISCCWQLTVKPIDNLSNDLFTCSIFCPFPCNCRFLQGNSLTVIVYIVLRIRLWLKILNDVTCLTSSLNTSSIKVHDWLINRSDSLQLNVTLRFGNCSKLTAWDLGRANTFPNTWLQKPICCIF